MESSDIIGYADPLVSYPGDKVALKVSCSRSTFQSRVFRLGAGYQHQDGPPISHRLVDKIPEQTHRGTPQFSRVGSSARIKSWDGSGLDTVDLITISFWCQATLPSEAKHDQFLFSSLDINQSTGFECLLDEDGHLLLRFGGPLNAFQIPLSISLVRYQWYHLQFCIDLSAGNIKLNAEAKARDIGERSAFLTEGHRLPQAARIATEKALTIASDSREPGPVPHSETSCSFNGKIDGFKLETTSKGDTVTLLDFDFSLDIPTDRIRDVSNGIHGELINGPSRAVTGHNWDASQSDWTLAKYGYGAIHFHDDDLDDAIWNTSFELDLSHDLQSGCYAVFVDDGETTDYIPFFVKPGPDAKEVPPVALIIPTFTYTGKSPLSPVAPVHDYDCCIAYANEHLHDETRTVCFPGDGEIDKHFRTMMKRPDLGISLYDSHNDGSGTCFSSVKRPILNMRPDYRMWLFDGPREFPADLWFVAFLERELGAAGFDIITDHQISEAGAPLLKKYKVLMSCSHPEYPTYNMLDSYSAFLDNGGCFMYLGGNGYYWATTHDPARSHRIEVRRADAGCRTFGLQPGNWHHSLTGEPGGLWRSRGRPPNQLFGLGSCAMGVGKGSGYGICEEARSHPRASRFLRGLETEQVIGDFGLVQSAASGDEIDRLDYELGTPRNAIIIATTKLAGDHSDKYLLFNEETLFPMVNTTGTTSEKIRSDIVFFETPSGGAVFSVGSINWVGALAWKAFDNNIATLTVNVLRDFMDCTKPG